MSRPTVVNHVLFALVFIACTAAVWLVIELANGQITIHTD